MDENIFFEDITRKEYGVRPIYLIIFFIFCESIIALTSYVTSPIARLHIEPNISSQSVLLEKGTIVNKIGEKDMFIKVTTDGKEGYVNKLFLSDKPTSGKISFASDIDQSTSVKARARASNFTQTAAARGFSESQTLRTRGGSNDYDIDSIKWLESIKIDEKEIEKFNN
jgi:hypothetical protein